MSREPGSYSRARCFSLHEETQTLGSGLWFNKNSHIQNIHCDHVKVVGPSETPGTTLKLLHAQQDAEIHMLIENQGLECRISCNYGNLVNFAS